MINLLPLQQQHEVRAARSNTLLLRYIILLFCALIFLAGALVFTYISLEANGTQADETKARNEQAATGFATTQAAAASLRSELSTAKSLFDEEIRYSRVLTRLSSLLPDGTAIDGITLNSGSFTQQTTLPVRVRGENEAKALQASFSASPYVQGVTMGNVSTNSTGGAYPYTVELIFTLNRSIAQ